MKVAFVENRYKTFFWSAIADQLSKEGIEITWLVQNPVFMPKGYSKEFLSLIKFPTKREFEPVNKASDLSRVKNSDRFINYFGGNDDHYGYYYEQIEKWVEHEKPDFVVGESTLFHEMIVIDICKSRSIPYIHPSMPGYPGGRYSFYLYDTKQYLLGETCSLSDEQCLETADSIKNRERIPDYMVPPSGQEVDRCHPMPGSVADRLKIFWGYFRGEKYNTPNPISKFLLNRNINRFLDEWDRISLISLETSSRYVLYPLQMQPEANLDVWGQKYRDQSKLIESISSNLPDGWKLLIKLNPKTKYELSESLLSVVKKRDNIAALPLKMPMSEAFDGSSLVITVTGTVAVECFLSFKPLIQLGPGIVEPGKGCSSLNNFSDLKGIVQNIEQNKFILAEDTDRVDLIRKIYSSTYKGIISDPVNKPSVMSFDNIDSVKTAMLKVFNFKNIV